MSFFDPPSPVPDVDPPDEHEQPRIGTYMPGVVPVELELGRSARAVVWLRELLAYPDGVELQILSCLSPEAAADAQEYFAARMALLHSRGPGANAITSARVVTRRAPTPGGASSPEPGAAADAKPRPPFTRPRVPFGLGPFGLGPFGFGPFGDEGAGLRVGFLFADGTKITTVDQLTFPPGREPTSGLEFCGGGTVGTTAAQSFGFFVWPVPPPGPLVVVVEWPGQEIAERRTVLDGEAVAAAVRRARLLWPGDDGLPSHHVSALTVWRLQQEERRQRGID